MHDPLSKLIKMQIPIRSIDLKISMRVLKIISMLMNSIADEGIYKIHLKCVCRAKLQVFEIHQIPKYF